MRVIEAPDRIDPGMGPYSLAVFLAGGISGCPDWQAELLEMLKYTNLLIFNPRRKEWPKFDGINRTLHQMAEGERQIAWEYNYLRQAGRIAFWFPRETVCPITLLEYGYALGRLTADDGPELYIGCHPDYARRFDVLHQWRVRGYVAPTYDSLAGLAAALKGADAESKRMCPGGSYWVER